MCEIRGNRIGMIFQEPMTALNPVHTIARQVGEPLRLHRGLSRADARKEALALLERVGIPDAARALDAYPHQFSGGQRQRIGIAMALACGPDLLIADEPTTALDVTIQKQILDLIQRPGGRARHGADPDLARPGRDRAERLEDAGDVRRQRGRERAHRGRLRRARRTPTRRACSPRGRRSARRAGRSSPPSAAACPNWSTCRPAAPSPGAAASPSTPATRRGRRPRRMPHGHEVRCIRLDAIARGGSRRRPPERAGRMSRSPCSKSTTWCATTRCRARSCFGPPPMVKALNGVSFSIAGRAAAWASSANRARASRPSRGW